MMRAMRGFLGVALVLTLGCNDGPGAGSDPCKTGKDYCTDTRFFFCDQGVSRVITCKGKCLTVCDTSMHSLGDGCLASGKLRCDPLNQQRALQCRDGGYEVYETCSGPRGCFVESNALRCELTVGDMCPASSEGRYSCDTLDTNQIVRCVDAGVVGTQRCPGTQNCITADGGLACQ